MGFGSFLFGKSLGINLDWDRERGEEGSRSSPAEEAAVEDDDGDDGEPPVLLAVVAVEYDSDGDSILVFWSTEC